MAPVSLQILSSTWYTSRMYRCSSIDSLRTSLSAVSAVDSSPQGMRGMAYTGLSFEKKVSLKCAAIG
eukprot:CAMPEP_0185586758 /NCGR_PEP_ID=MMETSP0434-20130131/45960_1 /TAXON_ID=626734 ORGANISM="Favella taraikaensis, Strain Fe Narragansett Bay" /NCGR_SAMPLE_ID=MMETSP0434 /ASSEMBLY_ACC=CAM_ASM_000379 /LENGTH=66 /DNA_ID=CAMNT_0028208123 /DNA_START=78 /DNA_END=275 /DNA_ORIENTATION=+